MADPILPSRPPSTTNYFESETPFPTAPPRYVASGSARKLHSATSVDSFLDQVNAPGGKNSTDPNFSDASEKGRNEFLEIPSFLYYPEDLGVNPRYHHFVVFNIYQGTSDEVRLDKRKLNLATSAVQAEGAAGAAITLQNKAEIQKTLEEAGATAGEIEEFLDRLGSVDGFGLSGDAAGNLIAAVSNGIKSLFGVSGAGAVTEEATGVAGLELSSLEQIGSAISELGIQGYEELTNTFNFVTQTEGDSAYSNLDETKVGITGKKVNKPKFEQGILVANRRFNNANVKSKDTISLYMPLKFTINDTLVYGEEEMGGIKLMASALSNQRGGVSALIERALVRGAADKIGGLVGQFTGEDINVGGIRSAMRRNAANPRREMLFKDVGMRSHSFDFVFSPKNQQEADMVLNIIRMFRFHAYPTLQEGGGHFFEFPAEFEMTFYTMDGTNMVVNDNLPKLPRLALTSVTVDYSGAGEFKTFEDAKPAFITLNLSFSEMEQLTSEHIIQGY